MANLLKAKKNPPFAWYYPWVALNDEGVPANSLEDGLKQPDTKRIKFDVPEVGANTRGRVREVSADIVPDKGIFGAEFPLVFTIPDFETKIRARLDPTAADFVAKLHQLFGDCLQGKGAAKWKDVLTKYPVADRTADTFKDAQRDYLEKVAGVKKLGDFIIRQLDNRKPATMPMEDYMARRQEWESYLDGGYLRLTFARPTAHQKAEQVFNGQPKAHQEKYAIKNDEVEDDLDALKTFFEGCHVTDVSDGTYANIVKSKREMARRAREGGGKTKATSHPTKSSYHQRCTDRRRERRQDDYHRSSYRSD
jgi:hypothetical protein